MKALIYKKANTLEHFSIKLEEVEDPTIKDKDLLIQVKSFSVNPGDAKIRQSFDAPEGGRIILGWEFSGVVIKTGKHTSGFSVGDTVFGVGDISRDGNYAELVAVDYRVVAHKPSSLDFSEAAGIPLTALTAMGAILDQNFIPYPNVKTILILGGTGGTGSIAIQYLKAQTDLTIIATASGEEAKAWAKQMGADFVIDHLADIEQQLRDIGFNQIDQIFSTSHTAVHMPWILNILSPYGHLSLIESPEALNQVTTHSSSFSIHWQMIFTRILKEHQPELQSKFLNQLRVLIDNGKIKTTVKTRLKGLTEETIKQAHTLIEKGKNIGKIVIEDIS